MELTSSNFTGNRADEGLRNLSNVLFANVYGDIISICNIMYG